MLTLLSYFCKTCLLIANLRFRSKANYLLLVMEYILSYDTINVNIPAALFF